MVQCASCRAIAHKLCQEQAGGEVVDDNGTSFCSLGCCTVKARLDQMVKDTAPSYKPVPGLPGFNYKMLHGDDGTFTNRQVLDSGYATLRDGIQLEDADGNDLVKQLVEDSLGEGFHLLVLRQKSHGVCALVFRVFGSRLAELPIAATKEGAKGKGHMRRLIQLLISILKTIGVAELCLPSCRMTITYWGLHDFEPVPANRQTVMRQLFNVQTYGSMTVMSCILIKEAPRVPFSKQALGPAQGMEGQQALQLGWGVPWHRLVDSIIRISSPEQLAKPKMALKEEKISKYLKYMLRLAHETGLMTYEQLESHFPGLLMTINPELEIQPDDPMSPSSVNPRNAPIQWPSPPAAGPSARSTSQDDHGGNQSPASSNAGPNNPNDSPGSVASGAAGSPSSAEKPYLTKKSLLSLSEKAVDFWDPVENGGRKPEDVALDSKEEVHFRCLGHDQIPQGQDAACGRVHKWSKRACDLEIRKGRLVLVCKVCSSSSRAAFCACLSVAESSELRDQYAASNSERPENVPVTDRDILCTWTCPKHPGHTWRATPRSRYEGKNKCKFCFPRQKAAKGEGAAFVR